MCVSVSVSSASDAKLSLFNSVAVMNKYQTRRLMHSCFLNLVFFSMDLDWM